MHPEQMRRTLDRRIEAAEQRRDSAADMVTSALEQARRFPTGGAWSTIAAYATLAAQAAGEVEGMSLVVDLLADED
jgi:hypothetical protein